MKIIRKASAGMAPSLFEEIFGKDWLSFDHPVKKATPAVNIKEDAQGFLIEMAVPGMNKNDFNIQLDKNEILISYEKKVEKPEKEKKYTRREFGTTSFKRTFILPETADQKKIAANYQDGILSINIPKQEEAKKKEPRLINVG
jgi:HSP20 family protein